MSVPKSFLSQLLDNINVTRRTTINKKPSIFKNIYYFIIYHDITFSFKHLLTAKSPLAKTDKKSPPDKQAYSDNPLLHIFRGFIISLLLIGLLEFIGQFITRGI